MHAVGVITTMFHIHVPDEGPLSSNTPHQICSVESIQRCQWMRFLNHPCCNHTTRLQIFQLHRQHTHGIAGVGRPHREPLQKTRKRDASSKSPLDFSPIGEKSSGLLGGGCFQSLLSWPRLVIYQTPPLPPPFPIAARNARLSLHQIFSFARFACVFVNI